MVTIKDVARLAGVSFSTVSRVLNQKKSVSPDTYRKVMEASEILQYTPNSIARSLKEGCTNTVALMVPSMRNHIVPEIAQGVEDTARKNGMTVILCNTNEDIGVEKEYLRKLKNQLVDGIIVTSMLKSSEHIRALQREGFPLVLAIRHYNDPIDAVAVDNRMAAYRAMEYLIKTGHRKIAIAVGRLELNVYVDRYKGYCEALEHYGIALEEALVLRETSGLESLYHLVRAMIRDGHQIDAIFATSDPKAIMVMKALRDCGLRIPQDVAVMGFDNIEISSALEPPLSTVSQPLYKIGVLAMEKLMAQIRAKVEGKEYKPSLSILDTELIVRKSTE
ncbi:MAG: LacI family DNA-binding transcriptional regulator [Clostridia bacterium]